jgi:hypothetical protein
MSCCVYGHSRTAICTSSLLRNRRPSTCCSYLSQNQFLHSCPVHISPWHAVLTCTMTVITDVPWTISELSVPIPHMLHSHYVIAIRLQWLQFMLNNVIISVDFSGSLQYSQNPPSARALGHLHSTCALKFTVNNIASHTRVMSGHLWGFQGKFYTHVSFAQCMLRA